MKLDPFISELLYEHDCVIIPGLGGVVTNHRTSFLNPAHHTFSPPSKRLAFNSSLKTNDGLLATHLSKRLSVNYTDANTYITDFVDNCIKSLQDGQKIGIDHVGVLYFDQENNLQFVPDANINYLKSSFGLFTIHSPAIKREEDNNEFVQSKGKVTRKKRKVISGWRIFEVVPVAAMLLFMVMNPNVVVTLNQQFASLNPFSRGAEIDINSTDINIPKQSISVPEVSEIRDADMAAIEDNSTATHQDVAVNTELKKDEAPVINLKSPSELNAGTKPDVNEDFTPKAPKVKSPAVSSVKLYYVIGGCFRIYENAENFRDQLIADGFQAAIIGQNDKGLHMVSLFSTTDMTRAGEELAIIQEKAEKGAWLLRK